VLLRALIHDLPGLSAGDAGDDLGPGLDVEVTSIDLDSRAVRPGSLFCCIRGAHTDGHEHARAAHLAHHRAALDDVDEEAGAVDFGDGRLETGDAERREGDEQQDDAADDVLPAAPLFT